MIVIPRVKPSIKAKLGKTLALCSVYRMLARHGWRKLGSPHPSSPGGSPSTTGVERKLPCLLDEIVKSFATATAMRLMFQDEARFGRISDTRYCWACRPVRPMVKAMLTHQYTYAYGAVSPMEGKIDSLVLPQLNT